VDLMVITSKDNETIKHIKKLKEKKYREEYKEFIVEGIKMVQEAIDEKAQIKSIIICDDCKVQANIPNELMYEIAKYNCIYVDKKIFLSLTDVVNPQGVLAVVSKNNFDKKIDYTEDIIVILDCVQDPGNLGTILRTIDSIGLKQVILSKGSGDIYNPKVVRSTMGAIFRVNVVEADNILENIAELKKHKFEILATSLEESVSIYDIEYDKKVIVIGNEGNGMARLVYENCDFIATIPMIGKINSLNASVAAGIVIFEATKNRK
jgi:TrmH family RNA methyltransferase